MPITRCHALFGAALATCVSCVGPENAPATERYVHLGQQTSIAPRPCLQAATSVYELRPNGQWQSLDSLRVVCGPGAGEPRVQTAWGRYQRDGLGIRFFLDSGRMHMGGKVIPIHEWSDAGRLYDDSLIIDPANDVVGGAPTLYRRAAVTSASRSEPSNER